MNYKTILLIGFVLVLLGAVLPWLIFMKIIPSTFPIDFFAFAVSIMGVFLGIIGAAWYTAEHRKKS